MSPGVKSPTAVQPIEVTMENPPAQSFYLLNWMKRIAKRPVGILTIILVITAVVALKIPWLTFSATVCDLIVDNLPERHDYEDFKALFGTDEIIQVVVRSDNIFAQQSFEQLRRLSTSLKTIPGVRRVISLPQVKAAVDPRNQWSVERFASLTTPVSIFQRNLFSTDHTTAGITLILENGADQDAVTQATGQALTQLDEHGSAYQIGMPTVSVALARYAQRDVLRLPLFTALIMALLLMIMYKRSVAVILPLSCVAVACLWTMGIMAWTGVSFNLLTVVVPILQIAVGTAYCLYIFCEFKCQAFVCQDACAALLATYSKTALPTLVAVATTISGILSLMVTPIGAVRHFSAFACLGVITMLLAVMTLYPCLLVLAWPLLHKRETPSAMWWVPTAWVDGLVYMITHHRRAIFSTLAVLAAVAFLGILKIHVETNALSYFKDSTPIIRHFHDSYTHLSGTFPLHLTVKANQEDYFLTMAALKELTAHQQFLETLPGVDKTLAFTDYLKLVSYVRNQFNPIHYALPEADYEVRMLVNDFKSLLGRDILRRYMSDDFTTANITMLTHLSSASGFLNTQEKIQNYCQSHQHGQCACRATGLGLVMSLGSHHLVKGQVGSLLITLIIIFILIHLMFLSVKIGVIAMAANLFPILVSFGAMGWLGIELSMGSCLIASIVVGLAVDDTIHYLARYKEAYTQEMDRIEAMRITLSQIGPPIVSTSLTTCAGFSILMFSSFTPTAVFGLLMTLAMISALSGGLFILPAMLSKVSPITLEEIFQIRIGGNRLQKVVPLLNGMTRLQVHRILKTGEIMRIEAGKHLFDKGDVADRMYVVISGVFDAVLLSPDAGGKDDAEDSMRFNRLNVGDVIGEMGMLTSGTRSVSVVAAASGEVLALSREHLEHIRRLNPRTASRFFANLSAILTQKLIHADHCLSNHCFIDEDTGLLKREAFLDVLEKEIARSRRHKTCATVCLLDITNHNHRLPSDQLAAEHLMDRAAAVLSDSLRNIDILGRFDTRTLAVLLVQTTAANAQKICRRLQRAFDRHFKLESSDDTAISCRFVDLEGLHAGDDDAQSQGDLARRLNTFIQQHSPYVVYPPSSDSATY